MHGAVTSPARSLSLCAVSTCVAPWHLRVHYEEELLRRALSTYAGTSGLTTCFSAARSGTPSMPMTRSPAWEISGRCRGDAGEMQGRCRAPRRA